LLLEVFVQATNHQWWMVAAGHQEFTIEHTRQLTKGQWYHKEVPNWESGYDFLVPISFLTYSQMHPVPTPHIVEGERTFWIDMTPT
jgi:hypothetical protein